MNVTVYTKPQCPQCDWTKKIFAAPPHPVKVTAIDITESLQAENYVISRSNEPQGQIQMPLVEITEPDGTIVDHWFGLKVDKIKGIKAAAHE